MSLHEILIGIAVIAGCMIAAYVLTVLFLWCILSLAVAQVQSTTTPDQTKP